MYNHNIEAMAQAIVDSGLTNDRESIEKILSNYWKTRIADVWSTNDVFCCAESIGINLTEDDAIEILLSVFDDFDASVGINWTVIEMHIRGYGESICNEEDGEDEDEGLEDEEE